MSSSRIGCQTCKLRRIKCDQTQPACQRCLKSQRTCVQRSTIQNACFSIHSENIYASGKEKRPRGPRSSLTILRPQIDLQTQALEYYLACHMQPQGVPKVSTGLSECVAEWRSSGSSSSMIDLALSSIALAVFARVMKYSAAVTEALRNYQRLLRVTRSRLAQLRNHMLDDRGIDECLLTGSLMARFENTARYLGSFSTQPTHLLQTCPHIDGQLTILEMWNDKNRHHYPTFIMKHTRRGLIRSGIIQGTPLPEWILDGARFGEEGVELEYDRVVIQTTTLHHAILRLWKTDVGHFVQALKLKDEASALDETLQAWASEIPRSCSYEQHTLTECGPWPKKHFFSPIVYSYSRPVSATVWCQYFAQRMLINSIRLKILQYIEVKCSSLFTTQDYGLQRIEYISQLQTMSNSLASTIPHCLERFRVETASSGSLPATIKFNKSEDIKPFLANLVAWPLTLASSIEIMHVRQRAWFRSQLTMLGQIIQDSALENFITTQEPSPFYNSGMISEDI